VGVVTGWTLVGCVFALPGLNGERWRPQLLASLAQWWSWGLLAPAIMAIGRRWPLSGPQLPRRMLIHLPLSVGLTAIYVYLFAGMRTALGLGQWAALLNGDVLWSALRGMFLWSWLVYWLILGAWQAHHYSRRYLASELRMARLERQSADARLNALRMQLDPHFLFNALNTISAQVERDPTMARDMIEHLGDLLRSSLESRDRQKVPLSEELALLEHYLAIQRIRFGERLIVEMHIDPETRFASVPALVVQPLVENAIRHGLSGRASGGTVTVSAAREGDQLHLAISDDGVGLPESWKIEHCAGFGLSITRERIAGLYPGRVAALSVERRPGGGVEARVLLPYELSNEGDDDGS
jgi:two-component system, LytTR family, sensor kinase